MKLFVLYTLLFCLLSFGIAQVERAEQLVREGKNDSALVLLEDLYAQNEEDPEVNYLLGTVSLSKGDYDAAIDYLDDAIDADESNHRYYFLRGNAYAVKAQNSGAIKAMFAAPKMKGDWEKSLELKPDFLPAKMSVFQFYLNAPGIAGGDDELALEMANDVLAENEPMGNLMLATYFYSAEEEMVKTEAYLQKSLAVDTTNAEYRRVNAGNVNLLNTLGYRYMQEDDLKKSRGYFRRAIQYAPTSANPHDSMGDFYVHITEYDSALISYEHALKNNPTFAPSIMNKGKMLEKLGRNQEAVATYKKLVLEQPESRYAEQAQDRLDELIE